MDITVYPSSLRGNVSAIASKSQAHRLLVCSAFADGPTTIICPDTNQDMEATVNCLQALGAEIIRTQTGYQVTPVQKLPETAKLFCKESGSTLRFLLPVVGALGMDAVFYMEGRLPKRPLSPLWEEMERMGCTLSRPASDTIRCQGRLMPGAYSLDGSVSSQFITGLLFAAALIPGISTLSITGKLESRPYIQMTQQAMAIFGVNSNQTAIRGGKPFHTPGQIAVEGDWSNAAFFLGANALGSSVTVTNLSVESLQGDRIVCELLTELNQNSVICISDIPDLMPILAVIAACKQGAVFTDIQRLRLKESDRVASVIAMIQSLGGKAEASDSTLTVYGTGLTGGIVDSANDHRIAMAAAIAATACKKPVTILGAQAVEKSYPQFWEIYRHLGGNYEQHLR